MIDALLAFIAALVCRESPRMAGLCLVYAGVRLSFVIFQPLPEGVVTWYLLCAGGELTVLCGALMVSAPASKLIARMSAFGIFVHLVAAVEYPTDYIVIFTLYPYLINYFVEAAQVAALYVFSPPGLRFFTRLWRSDKVKGGDSWMQPRLMLGSRSPRSS